MFTGRGTRRKSNGKTKPKTKRRTSSTVRRHRSKSPRPGLRGRALTKKQQQQQEKLDSIDRKLESLEKKLKQIKKEEKKTHNKAYDEAVKNYVTIYKDRYNESPSLIPTDIEDMKKFKRISPKEPTYPRLYSIGGNVYGSIFDPVEQYEYLPIYGYEGTVVKFIHINNINNNYFAVYDNENMIAGYIQKKDVNTTYYNPVKNADNVLLGYKVNPFANF